MRQRAGYDPYEIYNSDSDIRKVLEQLVDGTYSREGNLFNEIYTSLLKGTGYDRPDVYFNLKDFRAYAKAQECVNKAYKDRSHWAKMAILNIANVGKFSSDRTIEEYVRDIWHLEKITVNV